jgi:hypothetical protein
MTRRKIKVSLLRLRRWLAQRLLNPEQLSDSQKMGVRIFERTLSIENAEILVSPLSDSIYVEVNDIYLILERNDLQIINGKFQYDLRYSDNIRMKLLNKVFGVLERRRIQVEKRIKAKSDRTLNSILDEVEQIRESHNNKEN